MGAPYSTECDENLKIMTTTCEWAGLPVEPSESVGPATSLTFLGIEMDSIENSFRLPPNKLADNLVAGSCYGQPSRHASLAF